ncbi:MAG: ferritin family protein [Candidatus Aminicenantes bacterium]|nr:MAG: ferritin family protein [Candidatus Aminicenantes bacterium]
MIAEKCERWEEMMSLLGVEEILKYAIRIEENGEAFYRQWAKRAENNDQKKIFNFFADEENDHKKAFQSLMEEVKTADSQPEGISNQDHVEYLKTFTEELFNEKTREKEMRNVTNLISAVEFAMKQELDSLLFHMDLKTFVPREHAELMDKIITEERKHYTDLGKFKERLLEHGIK